MKSLAIIILAAGKGTRMKSELPKVLHPLLGRPLLSHVLENARSLRPEKTVVVVGHQAELVRQSFAHPGLTFVSQVPQLGTGHAVRQAAKDLDHFPGTILVLSGDIPLVSGATLKRLIQAHRRSGSPVTLLSTVLEEPCGYGRIIRDDRGGLLRIREEKDAAPEEQRLKEVNAGIYCFEADFLFSSLPRLSRRNRQREYYLTDLIEMAQVAERPVTVFLHPRAEEVLGINDRAELARTGRLLRRQINEDWMRRGVTLLDPDTAYIESDVRIGPDTTIGPYTVLAGRTRIGRGCTIPSHCVLENVRLKDGAQIDPFTRIRNGRIKPVREV
ncbi:MAG: bifunctional N-acetylglucosamine-1-phosphate uridyltransferase/glucosamine-1-phosphate acetyltransferase [Deltaproteobacteria bacterium]|nr:bifunctional N-acetylglucosamine-1-phosphate uridyltransferase/glucosamine-1-phosphate acetyltransferase [Deltaproteobacteria bacterium]